MSPHWEPGLDTHLLVRYPPSLSVSTLVSRLTGVSAHYLRKEFTGRTSRHLIHGHLRFRRTSPRPAAGHR
jgi:REP element-mobilizing transposase RayT